VRSHLPVEAMGRAAATAKDAAAAAVGLVPRDFIQSEEAEPHAKRRAEILKKHPVVSVSSTSLERRTCLLADRPKNKKQNIGTEVSKQRKLTTWSEASFLE